MNNAKIRAVGEADKNGTYPCFHSSEWESYEPENPCILNHQGCDGYYEWVKFEFNVRTGILISYYRCNAPGPGPGRGPWCKYPERIDIKEFDPDNLICPDPAGRGGGGEPPDDARVMTGYLYAICDTDWDGDCDEVDFDYASSAMGSSYGDPEYIFMADANRDDSVTEDDLRELYPRFKRGDVDGNGCVDIQDAILMANELSRPQPYFMCQDAADIDDDGMLSGGDSTLLVRYLFMLPNSDIPAPGPLRCGLDESHDSLKCTQYLLDTCTAVCPEPAVEFRRGDSNQDGTVDISDPIATLGFLFLGSPGALHCMDAADSNDDGKVDLSDAVFTLGYKFLGTRDIPAPGPFTCGVDPSSDDTLESCLFDSTKC